MSTMADSEDASIADEIQPSREGSPETFQISSRPSSRDSTTIGGMSKSPSQSKFPSRGSPEMMRTASGLMGADSSTVSGKASPGLDSLGSQALTIDNAVHDARGKLDHRKVVSTLPHNPIDSAGRKLQQYLVLSKLNVIKPSFRLKEGEYKKFGRMHKFSRNVYVAGYEQLDFTVSNGKSCWTGHINFQEHNVLRKRAGRDESWSVEKFIPVVQMTIQYPEAFDGLDVGVTIEKAKDGAKGLIMKLKGTRNGSSEQFIKPCALTLVQDDPDETKPKPPAKLFAETFNINNQHFLVACRTNNLERAKMLITKSKGNINVNYVDEFSGWSVFQFVCYHGYYDFANYLLIEYRETLLKDYISPHDGNTALHCAVMSGDLALVKLLILFDVIPDFVNTNGETPPELALVRGYRSIVQYFYDENSHIYKEGQKVYGVRSTEVNSMYVYLKPEREIDPSEYQWNPADYEDDSDSVTS